MKSIKRQNKTIYIITLLLSISIVNVVCRANSFALTYQDTLDTYFTFNSSISLSLSSADLVINDLSPNTYADSNIIDVITNTNNPTGYTLNASVGNSSTYTNTNLISTGSNNNGNTTYFSSLATTDSITSLSDMDTSVNSRWGYSFSTDSGTTWINANKTGAVHNLGYSGLPHFSTTPLELYNTSTNGSSIIKFKIGAKTTTNQIADTYSNVVNFTAVANYVPASIDNLIYMQDFAELTTTEKTEVLDSMTEGQQYQLIDNRDNIKYWIAKQADGKVWMTQNLDLCVGCSGTATLTSENTDLNVMGSGAEYDIYSVDYSEENNIITWNPTKTGTSSSSTSPITSDQQITYNGSTAGNVGTLTWPNSYTLPWSAEGGEKYYYAPDTNVQDTMSDTCDNKGHGTDWCKHYHAGNYYNWPESIASSNSTSLSANYATAENSICPAGWQLPHGQSSSTSTASSREFGQLLYKSGITNSITSAGADYTTNGAINIRKDPLYLSRSGYLGSGVLHDAAQSGAYWSSTVLSSTHAYALNFGSSDVYSAGTDSRFYGFSLRCVLR